MKYEFIETGLDTYELHYTNKDGIEKVIPFKRTVELAKRLQGADAEARIKLMTYLTEMGKTKEDFIIEKHIDGKIVRDETNYRELEARFIENEAVLLAMDLYKKLFNMELVDLLNDMSINENDLDKVQDFSLELRDILINGKVKTPSIQEINE